MAQMAKKVHWSSAAAGAAAAAKISKLEKTTKRFKLIKKRNPSSKLPKRSSHSLLCSLSRSCCCCRCRCCCYCRCCRCCCSRSRRFRSRTTLRVRDPKFFQITEKGEQSLQRRIRRQLTRSQLELIEPEPTMALEPSEITVAFFSHENANVSEPEEVPPCLDRDLAPNGELANS
uniref:Cysteine-rich perinuclear theca protein 8 n=1 Tax=Mus musculus TaxID=10090 RepID=Q3MSC8_MOUSE